jgi:hypothetical protein
LFDRCRGELTNVCVTAGQKPEDYFRFHLYTGRGRWLEYVTALALRARLAGLLKFANSFCEKAKGEPSDAMD